MDQDPFYDELIAYATQSDVIRKTEEKTYFNLLHNVRRFAVREGKDNVHDTTLNLIAQLAVLYPTPLMKPHIKGIIRRANETGHRPFAEFLTKVITAAKALRDAERLTIAEDGDWEEWIESM